ncbi:acylphosphatase-2 [Drosophila elegans]|uniref:acylphosphatase-2 n=1 Tax=Drosophila elegans TaxID=30023 RepID=UPI0007E61AFD|nr:acylphosphatase-2 [Drosophila elegans]
MASAGTQTEKKRRVTLPPSTPSDKSKDTKEIPQNEKNEDTTRISGNEFKKKEPTRESPNEPILRCQFEVFGIVQGVSFRMYTLRRAQKLGVRGWCKNTTDNTVKGEIQAYRHSFESMRLWLKHTGSPTSRIDKCIFSETTEIPEFTFGNFSIVVD